MTKTSTKQLEQTLSLIEWGAILLGILFFGIGAFLMTVGAYHAYINLCFGWAYAIELLIMGMIVGIIVLGLGSLVFFGIMVATSKRWCAIYPDLSNLD